MYDHIATLCTYRLHLITLLMPRYTLVTFQAAVHYMQDADLSRCVPKESEEVHQLKNLKYIHVILITIFNEGG